MSAQADPFRETPMSFDQWVESFNVPDSEEQLNIAKSAARLLKDAAFNRVISKLEAKSTHALLEAPLEDQVRVMNCKMLLGGLRAIRHELQAMAADVYFEEKTSPKQ